MKPLAQKAHEYLQKAISVDPNYANAWFYEKLVYIDSSGMGGLMAAANALHTAGGELRLSAVPAKVLRLMEVANLDRVFKIFENRKAALRGFGGPSSTE